MHEALAKSNFEREVGNLSLVFTRCHRWEVNSIEYPVVDVTFSGIRPLRVQLTCDNWPELPPSALLLMADGSPPVGLPGGVFHQDLHPTTGLPFVCMRGFREYHTHSNHLTDLWDTYRAQDGMNVAGLLTQLCVAWRTQVGL